MYNPKSAFKMNYLCQKCIHYTHFIVLSPLKLWQLGIKGKHPRPPSTWNTKFACILHFFVSYCRTVKHQNIMRRSMKKTLFVILAPLVQQSLSWLPPSQRSLSTTDDSIAISLYTERASVILWIPAKVHNMPTSLHRQYDHLQVKLSIIMFSFFFLLVPDLKYL